jgi:hypothetical protein
MKAERQKKLSRLLTFLSFLLLVVSTTFFVRIKAAGGDVPIWLMGLVGYSWIFFAFLLANQFAHKVSRRRR